MDRLIKATIEGGIRIYALTAKDLVNEACERHQCSPLSSAALGRTLMGALFLAATMKNNEAVTVKINGDGILGSIVADACGGYVRGYVENTNAELPLTNGKLSVGAAVGLGNIAVTRFNDGSDPFTGVCNLATGEIAEDFTRYLYVSEQTPSSFVLGVYVNEDGTIGQAGGLFIQAMPDAEDEKLDAVATNIGLLPSMTNLLRNNNSLEEIVSMVAGNLSVNYYEQTELHFACQCSHEKIKNMLVSLGKEELQKLAEDEVTEINCHFCNTKYTISSQEIAELAKEIQ